MTVAAEKQRRYRARQRGEDVPVIKHPGRKPISDDDPRRERARVMYSEGMSTRQIRAQLGLRWSILRRFLEGVERGLPSEPNITPAPYAKGFRWTNTKWA